MGGTFEHATLIESEHCRQWRKQIIGISEIQLYWPLCVNVRESGIVPLDAKRFGLLMENLVTNRIFSFWPVN